MVFQSYALYPHMTVAENLGFGLKLRGHSEDGHRGTGCSRRRRRSSSTQMLERLPRQLSGGQRQRVALGRALVRHPQVFLLDEPLSNLDAKLRASMRTEIARLHRALGTTMIYVTHDQVEAMTLGQRIVVLERGVVQQIDAPMRIYERPANLFVAGFLGNPAMNLLARSRARRRDGDRRAGRQCCRSADAGVSRPRSRRRASVRRTCIASTRRDSAAQHSPRPRPSSSIESIGNEAFMHARCGAWPLIARSSPYDLPAVGAQITLQIAPERMHFFDAAERRDALLA